MKKNKEKKPPILKGLGVYDKDELKLVKENKLLRQIYVGVSAACDLNCIYCQTKSGKAMPGELSLAERVDLLNQAKELGCEFVHIAARGEPTVDPLFLSQLEHIHKLNMIPVIFTHGGNINEYWADNLFKNNASVIVKIHSMDHKLQDFFAGKKGYAKRRDDGIQMLIKKGFNKSNPTRLGADILVMKKNYDEIEKIFIWCRENNIFPLVKQFLVNERGKSKYVMDNLYVEPLKIKELYHRLAKIDKERYGYVWDPTPPYAGISCNYYLYHILVTIMGDAWPCIGLEHLKLGNIRNGKLKDFWNHPTMDKIRNIKENINGVCRTCSKLENDECYGCPCRRTYLKGPDSTFVCNSCWEDNL